MRVEPELERCRGVLGRLCQVRQKKTADKAGLVRKEEQKGQLG